MDPSFVTVKRLFALSQNRCAFRGCEFPIVEESETVTGVICHIKARSVGGPRYDAHQTDEERHSFANLILLCARHSKLIDSEPERYTADVLREMKGEHERGGWIELSQSDAHKAELLLKSYRAISFTVGGHVMVDSPGSVQASTVVFRSQKKTVKIAAPAGSVASDLSSLNYIKHLIEQYQEFAKHQPGREYRYAAIYAAIKRRFGAKWDYVPLGQFDDLVLFLQQRVDRTMLGCMNRSKGFPNYSTFAEYRAKYGSR